ncbi:MAG: UvrB/UvrC motif-containing protein [Bacillota bacterium]
MLCQECRKRPATLHYTKIINGQKTELHLCQECAEEHKDLMEASFAFPNFVAGLMNPGFLGKQLPGSGDVRCPTCGLTYQQFASSGRLGCGECYQHFDERMEPLLRRIHGNTVHSGKVPARAGGAVRVKKELNSLKSELQKAVAREDFERAAELRDRIKDLEKKVR